MDVAFYFTLYGDTKETKGVTIYSWVYFAEKRGSPVWLPVAQNHIEECVPTFCDLIERTKGKPQWILSPSP